MKKIVKIKESELRKMIENMLNEQEPEIMEPEIDEPDVKPGIEPETDEPDTGLPERKPRRNPFAVPPHIRPGQEPQPRAKREIRLTESQFEKIIENIIKEQKGIEF